MSEENAWSVPDAELMSSLESPAEQPTEVQEQVSEDVGQPTEFAEETHGEAPSTEEVDVTSEYQKLLQPFKANGTEMSVENVDQAIRLMQMGANYNQKMADMKPQKKIVAMLEKQGLLDETKLNHLIDIYQKKPEAIAKFLKDSEIDTYDLPMEDSEYTPTNYSVDDNELAFDEVLSELKSSPHGSEAIQVIQGWDEQSVNYMVTHPDTMKVVRDHIANGVYQKVMTEVSRRKVFGEAPNVPDFQLYHQVGSEMANKGMFNADAQQPTVIKGSTDSRTQIEERKQTMKATRQPTQTPPSSNSSNKSVNMMTDDEVKAWVESNMI